MLELLGRWLIQQPVHILAVAGVHMALWAACRATALGRIPKANVLWVPALSWLAFAAWEWLVLVQSPEADIRVDLLLILPVLALVMLWAYFRAARGLWLATFPVILACCVLASGLGWTSGAVAQAVPAVAPSAAEASSAAASAASSAKSGADGGNAFDVVAAEPVDLGEPDSPRASLAHYFGAVRQGRWQDATRYLVLHGLPAARLPRRWAVHQPDHVDRGRQR